MTGISNFILVHEKNSILGAAGDHDLRILKLCRYQSLILCTLPSYNIIVIVVIDMALIIIVSALLVI